MLPLFLPHWQIALAFIVSGSSSQLLSHAPVASFYESRSWQSCRWSMSGHRPGFHNVSEAQGFPQGAANVLGLSRVHFKDAIISVAPCSETGFFPWAAVPTPPVTRRRNMASILLGGISRRRPATRPERPYRLRQRTARQPREGQRERSLRHPSRQVHVAPDRIDGCKRDGASAPPA